MFVSAEIRAEEKRKRTARVMIEKGLRRYGV